MGDVLLTIIGVILLSLVLLVLYAPLIDEGNRLREERDRLIARRGTIDEAIEQEHQIIRDIANAYVASIDNRVREEEKYRGEG